MAFNKVLMVLFTVSMWSPIRRTRLYRPRCLPVVGSGLPDHDLDVGNDKLISNQNPQTGSFNRNNRVVGV
eukprot:4215765-Pyramimonas_sp.AAC.2